MRSNRLLFAAVPAGLVLILALSSLGRGEGDPGANPAPGDEPARLSAPTDPAPAAASADPAEPDTTASLCGRVVEAGARAPASEAVVALRRTGAGSFTVQTDRDGGFCATGLPPGVYALAARAGLRASETLEGVPLEAGEELRDIVLALEAGVSVSGRILDRLTGGPVSAAQVSVRSSAGLSLGSAIADRSGDYRVQVVLGTHALEVEAAGYARRTVSLEVPSRRPLTDVDLILDPGARISGRVLSPDGVPVAGASVQALTYRLGAWTGSREPEARTASDAEGRYALAAPPGLLTLVARAEGHGVARKDAVEVGAGQSLELDLTLARAGGLVVEVLGAEGQPVPGASVSAWCDGDLPCGNVTSGPAGEARLDGLSPGPVQVQASAPSHGQARIEVRLEPGVVRRISMALAGTGHLTGSVTADRGQPVVGADVHFVPETGGSAPRRTRTDAEGQFHAEVPVGLPFTVRAEATGLGSAELTGRLAGDRVSLELRRAGRIAGWVTGPSGRPLTDFTVVVVPAEDGDARGYRRQRFAAESGDFVVSDVPPGGYRVRAVAAGFAASEPVPVHVAPDAEAGPVQLSLGGAGRIRGRVLGPDGRPVQGARISFRRGGIFGPERWSGEGGPPTESGPDGGFLLTDVPAGRGHPIFAWHTDQLVGSAGPVAVTAGEEAGPVVVRLRRVPHRIGPEEESFGGIGMGIVAGRDGRLMVQRVYEGGPAFLSGVQAGDAILAVDGLDTGTLGLRGALDAIRGPVGTPVALLLERPTGGRFTARVVRVRLQM